VLIMPTPHDSVTRMMIEAIEYPCWPTQVVCHCSSIASCTQRAMRSNMQILELASFSDTPSPSVTRLVFTDRDMKARRSGS